MNPEQLNVALQIHLAETTVERDHYRQQVMELRQKVKELEEAKPDEKESPQAP